MSPYDAKMKKEFLPPPVPSSLAQRVSGLRKMRGMSQGDLAALVGIKQPSLSDIETGDTSADNVKAVTLVGLARALATSADYLLGIARSPVPPENLGIEESELISLYRTLDPSPKVQESVLSHMRILASTFGPTGPTQNNPFPRAKA